MNKINISVVTVCYNAADVIEKTILSVLEQTYTNIEYIIVDGKSTDATMEIVRKYKNSINKIVSEPDGGIYYAMNKGIDLSTGDYCIFMNAGDTFYSKYSIEKSVAKFENKADVIYGNTEYIYDTGVVILPPKSLEYVLKGAFCCHQSTFFKRDILVVDRYDTSYRIIADWALYKTLFEKHKIFLHINEIVASYDNKQGASTSLKISSYIKQEKERLHCIGKENSLIANIHMYFDAVAFFIRRRILIPLMPVSLYKYLKNKWVVFDVKRKS